MKIKEPLVCAKCKKVDQNNLLSTPFSIGTSVKMKCPDCCDESGFAQLCRKCCPTEHGTKTDWEN